MMQSDEKGNWHPTKIFPCDCGSEGTMVTIEEDAELFDCEGAPFIGMSFWEFQAKLDDSGHLHMSRWSRIKYAWGILRGKSPWTDMVWMRAAVAKNLAHHILYLIGKAKSKEKKRKEKPIVELVEPIPSSVEDLSEAAERG